MAEVCSFVYCLGYFVQVSAALPRQPCLTGALFWGQASQNVCGIGTARSRVGMSFFYSPFPASFFCLLLSFASNRNPNVLARQMSGPHFNTCAYDYGHVRNVASWEFFFFLLASPQVTTQQSEKREAKRSGPIPEAGGLGPRQGTSATKAQSSWGCLAQRWVGVFRSHLSWLVVSHTQIWSESSRGVRTFDDHICCRLLLCTMPQIR